MREIHVLKKVVAEGGPCPLIVRDPGGRPYLAAAVEVRGTVRLVYNAAQDNERHPRLWLETDGEITLTNARGEQLVLGALED